MLERPTAAARDAFNSPGFVPAYVRPLFCRGVGPLRWAAIACAREQGLDLPMLGR